MKIVVKSKPWSGKLAKRLESLPKIYLIACWANWGVLELPFSGKYTKDGNVDIPLVWNFDDNNGTYAEFQLMPITYITTGQILCWTQYQENACRIAASLNSQKESSLPY